MPPAIIFLFFNFCKIIKLHQFVGACGFLTRRKTRQNSEQAAVLRLAGAFGEERPSMEPAVQPVQPPATALKHHKDKRTQNWPSKDANAANQGAGGSSNG